MDADTMDEKRKEHVAYEYLCHLEEAKKLATHITLSCTFCYFLHTCIYMIVAAMDTLHIQCYSITCTVYVHVHILHFEITHVCVYCPV